MIVFHFHFQFETVVNLVSTLSQTVASSQQRQELTRPRNYDLCHYKVMNTIKLIIYTSLLSHLNTAVVDEWFNEEISTLILLTDWLLDLIISRQEPASKLFPGNDQVGQGLYQAGPHLWQTLPSPDLVSRSQLRSSRRNNDTYSKQLVPSLSSYLIDGLEVINKDMRCSS